MLVPSISWHFFSGQDKARLIQLITLDYFSKHKTFCIQTPNLLNMKSELMADFETL